MLTHLKHRIRNRLYKIRSYCIAKIGKSVMRGLLWTCQFEVEGLERFCELARKEKCMMMLWHNRLAVIPFILFRFAPQFIYAAVVSASRDGDMIGTIVQSFKHGRIIRVSHQARYQALKELIQSVEEQQHVVVITPDGPRGPRYELKAGIAVAALETKAYVIALDWKAQHFWELKTWDRLRIPKPFTKIKVSFLDPVRFDETPLPSLEQAKSRLKEALPE